MRESHGYLQSCAQGCSMRSPTCPMPTMHPIQHLLHSPPALHLPQFLIDKHGNAVKRYGSGKS